MELRHDLGLALAVVVHERSGIGPEDRDYEDAD
jgi:hypothetical protein